MRIHAFTCVAILAAVPASAQEVTLGVELIPGHPVYHEREQEAGVAMALSITAGNGYPTSLTELCEDLRIAAGLGTANGNAFRLETIFVVPHKGMVVEGYYWAKDGTPGSALVPGNRVPRGMLDDILTRAGIPPRVLDETNVEHEVSCHTGEPLWNIAWYDVRLIGDEEPGTMIERAHDRFLAIHQSVVEHNTRGQLVRME